MNIVLIQPEMFEKEEDSYLEIQNLMGRIPSIEEDCDLVCLPERWIKTNPNLEKNIQKERGPHYHFIKKIAKKYHVNMLSGGIWENREKSNKNYITCYYFDKNGEEIGRQDKIHLYLFEKQYFEPGDTLNLFNLDGSLFSVLICFDMVFETPRLAVKNGAELLISPTLIREEGLENWGIYLKAKSLENKVPIAACNPYGVLKDIMYPGNSKIISFEKGFYSPSKLKILEAPLNKNAILSKNIDLEFPNKLRRDRFKESVNLDKIQLKKYK